MRHNCVLVVRENCIITLTSAQATKYNGSYIEVDYIPQEFNILAKNKAALNLLDNDMAQMNPGDDNVDNPRVSRIAKRISRIENDMMPVECQGSYENKDYDVRERERIYQDRFQTNPTY